ncbi:hypothetical protein BXQ17_11200 [Polaribacter sp. BM10]|uniref:hypothetical protein n=1 Tax=Polaribacter sp. BM10 TaxID=1529069 RepID=UPI00098AD785|nr:hypothetical protein [Polaribacter sp. BM10]AQS94601.1 hypothetical protein BXQ17_11200 [Polaribacter sp. BM10]
MERDIRDLFKVKNDFKKDLPKNHREDFIKKLGEHQPKKEPKKSYKFLKIVASLLLIISCVLLYKNTISLTQKSAIELQMQAIEKDYLNSINNEWNSFKEIATDTILVNKYEEKLEKSKLEYGKITKQLKGFPNDINLLESLITNLQRRLQLIKEINEHIKELNPKSTSNETIYI